MFKIRKIGLTAKLVIAVLSSSIAIYLLVFAIGYSLTNRVIYKDVEKIGDKIVDVAGDRINSVAEQVARITNLMNLLAKYKFNNEQDLFKILKNIIKNNGAIFGISISYEPYVIKSNEKFFSPYCYRSDTDIKCEKLGGPDYDYFGMVWYRDPKTTGQSMWTDPYTDDSAKGKYLLSHSAPFYKKIDGRDVFQGIVSADIALEWLQDVILKVGGKYRGYAFLISQDGTFITFPKEGFALKKNIRDFAGIEKIAGEMTAGRTGIAPIKDIVTGIPSWIFYKPVHLSDWSIGVVFEEREILWSLYYIAHRMIVLYLLGIVILFFVVFFLSRRITRPLNMLSSTAREISTGDLNVKVPATERKDEVGMLARSFASMQEDLKQYIMELSRTISAQERIANELRLAHDIQQSIVPKEFPRMGDLKNVEVFGRLLPALEVGGDLYDCFEIDGKHTCFIVGDVSDKGVHAAFIMAIVSTLLQGLSHDLRHPDGLLRIVNREILKRNSESMFVTLFCGILNNETGRFRYSNAGHVPPVLIRNGAKPILITGAAGKALGVDPKAEFPWGSIMLSSADKVFIYTDGVTDVLSAAGELFGEDRLTDELASHAGDSPKMLVEDVISAVKRHSGGAKFPDDIAILCLSMISCDPKRMNLTLTNDLSEIHRLAELTSEFCGGFGCGKELINDINVALEETITNIVRFAYNDAVEHTIDVSLIYATDRLEMTIVDDGRPFDPLKAAAPDTALPLEERPIGGRGIELVKKMVDMISYELVGNFNKLTLVKNFKGGKNGR